MKEVTNKNILFNGIPSNLTCVPTESTLSPFPCSKFGRPFKKTVHFQAQWRKTNLCLIETNFYTHVPNNKYCTGNNSRSSNGNNDNINDEKQN